MSQRLPTVLSEGQVRSLLLALRMPLYRVLFGHYLLPTPAAPPPTLVTARATRSVRTPPVQAVTKSP